MEKLDSDNAQTDLNLPCTPMQTCTLSKILAQYLHFRAEVYEVIEKNNRTDPL